MATIMMMLYFISAFTAFHTVVLGQEDIEAATVVGAGAKTTAARPRGLKRIRRLVEAASSPGGTSTLGRDLFLRNPTTQDENGPTTVSPTPSPPPVLVVDNNNYNCPVECPCCSVFWPNFARAVQGFNSNGSCYSRQDDGSDIIAIVNCEATDQPVAYFSFDYSGARASAGESQSQYCGQSDSDINLLSIEEATACQQLLQGLVSDANVECNDSFDCS